MQVGRYAGMQVCRYAGMLVCWHAGMQGRRNAGMQVCRYAGMRVGMQVCRYAGMQVLCRYAAAQVCSYAGMQVCRYAGMQVCRYAYSLPCLPCCLPRSLAMPTLLSTACTPRLPQRGARRAPACRLRYGAPPVGGASSRVEVSQPCKV